MARYVARCDECGGGNLCARHLAMDASRDAALAAELGIGWARFVWASNLWRRRWDDAPWRVPEAMRLTSWLASEESRRRELVELCDWRAGLEWDVLHRQAGRDPVWRDRSRAVDVYALQDHPHVRINFRVRDDSPPPRRHPSDISIQRSATKRKCGECSHRGRCSRHIECSARRDARLAVDVGDRWAIFAWQVTDTRNKPWPISSDACIERATRLVGWLARHGDDARQLELAHLCSWGAWMRWEALQIESRENGRPEMRDVRAEFSLCGAPHVSIAFRLPDQSRTVNLARAALDRDRGRAARFRAPHGIGDILAYSKRPKRGA